MKDILIFLAKYVLIVLVWYSIIAFITWNPLWFIEDWLSRLIAVVFLIGSIIGALQEY